MIKFRAENEQDKSVVLTVYLLTNTSGETCVRLSEADGANQQSVALFRNDGTLYLFTINPDVAEKWGIELQDDRMIVVQ